jgi:arylsulfatase A
MKGNSWSGSVTACRMAGQLKRFLLPCLLCIPWWLTICSVSAAKPQLGGALNAGPARTSPNVIFMMADDMGMGDTSAYQDFTGNSDADQVHTPAMDKLARMGVRFTDAHTPSSRCSPTRYGLLTGRYPWRNRLKHWVLFGVQGDPMIEADRPTLATLFRDSGYRTAIVGKWHVGLRYSQSNGKPADAWEDADLTKPLAVSPVDHGFEFCRITSRSHGTSGPDASAKATAGKAKGKGKKKKKNAGKRNGPNQSVGPGHIHGRVAIGATGEGKKLVGKGANAYVLSELGGRHSDSAMEFLNGHVSEADSKGKPFFLYYPANSNHGPHTPDSKVGGKPVKGAGRSVAGKPMDTRSDYIYENDVALGRFIDWLETTDDPRRPGEKLIGNTIVIFTSDNGAEKNSDIATGPFRSHKGSCYEGGHRVPFIVSWPQGGVGDGVSKTPGRSDDSLIGLTDIFATFADALGKPLPDLRAGEKGAEDSVSVLAAWRGKAIPNRPMFFNDHKEAKADHAAVAMRLDDPVVDGRRFEGKWKVFFDAALLRKGEANPIELFDLASDSWEKEDLLSLATLKPLVEHLTKQALLHRNSGGHRLAEFAPRASIVFDWRTDTATAYPGGVLRVGVAKSYLDASTDGVETRRAGGLVMTVSGVRGDRFLKSRFKPNNRGLGIEGGQFDQIDGGEALLIRFDRDVLIESAAIVAGNGVVGGYYRMGNRAPLAIYCVDGDIDAQDQSGLLSDLGVLRKGKALRLDSSPHHGVEAAGRWRLGSLTIRVLE